VKKMLMALIIALIALAHVAIAQEIKPLSYSEGDISSVMADEPVQNTIHVLIKEQQVTLGSSDVIEGDTMTISGVVKPYDFLNNTSISFPDGCLSEDITVTVQVPDIGHVNFFTMDVVFPDSILAGISFEVSVNDNVVSPYYFDTPLEVTFSYTDSFLAQQGITADDIGIFYITAAGELVEEGITDIVLDESNKLIHGKVAHFSDVVLAQKPAVPVTVENNIPGGFSLAANYPNPFNPTTTISFSTPELSTVNVTIFNMLGQHVVTLADGIKPAGTYSIVWNGKNEAGMAVTSGIYFYRLRAGNFSETKKLVLMR